MFCVLAFITAYGVVLAPWFAVFTILSALATQFAKTDLRMPARIGFLGFLGFLGCLGFLPGMGVLHFLFAFGGLFGFFGFLGLKSKSG